MLLRRRLLSPCVCVCISDHKIVCLVLTRRPSERLQRPRLSITTRENRSHGVAQTNASFSHGQKKKITHTHIEVYSCKCTTRVLLLTCSAHRVVVFLPIRTELDRICCDNNHNNDTTITVTVVVITAIISYKRDNQH